MKTFHSVCGRLLEGCANVKKIPLDEETPRRQCSLEARIDTRAPATHSPGTSSTQVEARLVAAVQDLFCRKPWDVALSCRRSLDALSQEVVPSF